MSWSVSVTATKEEAKQAVKTATDAQSGMNYMTPKQVEMMQAVIDALPGTHVQISASGHNDVDPAAPHADPVKGYFSISASGS